MYYRHAVSGILNTFGSSYGFFLFIIYFSTSSEARYKWDVYIRKIFLKGEFTGTDDSTTDYIFLKGEFTDDSSLNIGDIAPDFEVDTYEDVPDSFQR